MASFAERIIPALSHARRRLLGRRPCPGGAHAVALTPAGKIVLVKLRYASGWRLPGGGRDEPEELEEAALRELREEIGMTSYRSVRRSSVPGLVVVEGVIYRPRRWSWEVARVCEAPLDGLPASLSPVARRWIAAVRSTL